MAKQNTVPFRTDGKVVNIFRELQHIRVRKGLATIKEMTDPEITRLLSKTQGFKLSVEELKTKPKRRDLI